MTHYPQLSARDILMTEALATLVAGLCGGVVQNTPYIGHPAYKAMGAGAACRRSSLARQWLTR